MTSCSGVGARREWFGFRLGIGWLLFGKPVGGHPPGNAREKCSLVFYLLPCLAAIELQEGLLYGVLGIVAVAQDGVGYAKDEM
jgi:hypothetical protein